MPDNIPTLTLTPASTTFAQRLFTASMAYQILDDELTDHISSIFGSSDAWPFEDITHDYYDNSFELKDVQLSLVPSPDQLDKCWALGFSRCWICYVDGSERYFGKC